MKHAHLKENVDIGVVGGEGEEECVNDSDVLKDPLNGQGQENREVAAWGLLQMTERKGVG